MIETHERPLALRPLPLEAELHHVVLSVAAVHVLVDVVVLSDVIRLVTIDFLVFEYRMLYLASMVTPHFVTLATSHMLSGVLNRPILSRRL